MGQFLLIIGWLLFSYLLGSIPFGLIIGRKVCKVDPREHGSQNTGATNIARVCGYRYGLVTLALDIIKGALPVGLALIVTSSPLVLSLAGLAALLGHMFSVFLKGKGGKGVATCIGTFLVPALWPMLLSILICLLLIWWTGFVSVGSLALVSALPILLLFFGQWYFVPWALVALVLVFWRHKENIYRLARGEENPWRKRQGQS
jgi:glycerol-3-phosphate acyltransferase PlsY